MVASVKRNKNDQMQKNCLSSLYFWEELNIFDYHLNTRVDNIHGEEIYGILNFQTKKEKSEEGFYYFKYISLYDHKKEIFVTYGTDNTFKLWKRFIKEKTNKFNGNKKFEIQEYNQPQEEKILYFWNCFYENGYKNLMINDMCYIYDEVKKTDFLCFTIQNGVAIWVLFFNNFLII